MNTAPKLYEDLDMHFLTRELDRAKSELFAHKYAAFYGSLLCSLNFYWDANIQTAATDGVNLMWNPYWFQQLKPKTRVTVLIHEVQHVAKLHFARMGERNPKLWNYATDIRINNDLTSEGYSFEGIEWGWRDPSFGPGVPEEDIYDALLALGQQPNPNLGSWGQQLPQQDPNASTPGQMPGLDGTDLFPSGPITKEDMVKAINNVVQAGAQAKLAGPGKMPGDIETLLTTFLAPMVPWEQLLHRFMQELCEHGYSWRKPNRRFTNLYLPSHYDEEGALEHLAYFEDTSGSISDADALRFNSEFKYVKETYEPRKMTLIQFDTQIQDERVYLDTDPFDQVVIKGRGGTSLEPVREWINKHKPTAAVIFSDLECAPMGPLDFQIPVIWVCISNRKAIVPFGEIIHIR